MIYDNKNPISYWQWIGRYANCQFDYFARHDKGKKINYQFNTLGYRGPEHFQDPDISVFGSSFSFGVGIEFEQCWHQLLGNYRVNCYAPAGILVTNNDIIDHYNKSNISSGKVILQFREYRYNVGKMIIPDSVMSFVIDEQHQPGLLNLSWRSFIDTAEDHVHPGPMTHKLWANIIKKTFNL